MRGTDQKPKADAVLFLITLLVGPTLVGTGEHKSTTSSPTCSCTIRIKGLER